MRLNPNDKALAFKDPLSGKTYGPQIKDIRYVINSEGEDTIHIVDKSGKAVTIGADRDLQIKLFKFFAKLKHVKIMKGIFNTSLGVGTAEPI